MGHHKSGDSVEVQYYRDKLKNGGQGFHVPTSSPRQSHSASTKAKQFQVWARGRRPANDAWRKGETGMHE